ncbi:hypothetical protein [Actinokineospora sp. HUAS TT18]|uniref:hypothetical protein n=1 Tax=Actinokineospora sp. HUAS TT18 TaxID=3447451 RepID=UPI003F51E9DF
MSEGQSTSSVVKLLPPLAVAAALGIAVFLFLVTGRHPATLAPALVYLAALITMVWTPVGRLQVSRIGLGVLLVGASVAMMAVMYVEGGRNLTSLNFGGMFLITAVAVTFFGAAGEKPAHAAADWLPLLGAVGAAVAMTELYVYTANLSTLVIGGLFAVVSIITLAAATTAGPPKFAIGLVAVAVAVGLIYLSAISGAVVPGIVLGGLVLVSAGQLLGAGVRPAQQSAPH